VRGSLGSQDARGGVAEIACVRAVYPDPAVTGFDAAKIVVLFVFDRVSMRIGAIRDRPVPSLGL